ncbi:DUF6520 family protein [Filimonas lacunae]|nr:DUF6520 family protein [Filimonas lacunae]
MPNYIQKVGDFITQKFSFFYKKSKITMNKVKYVLSAITMIAAVGGAFAFKKAATGDKLIYLYTSLKTRCTLPVQGYLAPLNTPGGIPTGYVLTSYATAINRASCQAQGYFQNNSF